MVPVGSEMLGPETSKLYFHIFGKSDDFSICVAAKFVGGLHFRTDFRFFCHSGEINNALM